MKKSKQLKLGIIGHGFVGKATDDGFRKNVKKFIVDPILGTNIDDLVKFCPEIIFVCVPTPMSDDGSQDSSIIYNVIKELSKKCPKSIKVVKSTVLPNILKNITKIDSKVIYNPEFLREKYANEDFINSKFLIFGGKKDLCEIVSNAYSNHSDCKTKDHVFTDIESASLIKYTINTFLAAKVIFFNEINLLFKNINSEISWQEMINIVSKDGRIGSSHMNVPGHDGRKGFGGACFPKDSVALVRYAKDINLDMTLLTSVIKTNNVIRSTYDDQNQREVDQNVTFDDKI